MSRPPLEVADLIRSAGAAFIERNRQWIGWRHVKVLLAIARCRTRHSAVMSINALAAGIAPPFRTTAAALTYVGSITHRIPTPPASTILSTDLAEVPTGHAHAHRFRDTFAVEAQLAQGVPALPPRLGGSDST
jgi:hypothetical protein